MTGPADTAAARISAFLDATHSADDANAIVIADANTAADAYALLADVTIADLRAVLDEREQLTARVAELEAEREADTRAVNDLLAALDMVTSRLHIGTLVKVELLRVRFADRIAALGTEDTADGSAR